jgi:hypothetical protein
MKTQNSNTYTAFEGLKFLVQGDLEEVVLKVKKHIGTADISSVLIFSNSTGKTMDFNFQGTKQDVQKRLELYTSKEVNSDTSGPGRPKLGVISREISLLPNHWEWLATQSGGASSTIRNLIEDARKKSSGIVSVKQIQERAYKVMSVLAGDLENYEEALRALYKKDQKIFSQNIHSWPVDVKKYLNEITKPLFE